MGPRSARFREGAVMTMTPPRLPPYTFFVRYSEQDKAYIGRVLEWPSLAAHGPTAIAALDEIEHLLDHVLEDLKEHPLVPGGAQEDQNTHPATPLVRELIDAACEFRCANGTPTFEQGRRLGVALTVVKEMFK